MVLFVNSKVFERDNDCREKSGYSREEFSIYNGNPPVGSEIPDQKKNDTSTSIKCGVSVR